MYKFIGEDDKAFTLEKNGKKFKVAKKAVSEKFHQQVRNYAEGGEVESSDPVVSQTSKEIYQQESNSGKADTSKPSYAGAVGPYQIMPSTFEGLKKSGKIPKDADIVKDNKFVHDALMQELSETPKIKNIKDPELKKQALKAAYYGGPKAVRDDGSIVDFGDNKNPEAPTTTEYAQTQPFQATAQPASNKVVPTDPPFYQRQPIDYGNMQAATQFDQKQPPAYDYGPQQERTMNETLGIPTIPNPFDNELSNAMGPGRMFAGGQKQAAQAPAPAPLQQEQAQPIQIQQQQEQAAPQTGMQSQYEDYLKQQQEAMNLSGKADTDLAAENIKTLQQRQKDYDSSIQRQQEIAAQSSKAIDDFANEYKNQKIDPQRLFANKSTGDKIMGAIGILLSGIGSGLTGQPNMALKIMGDAIDKDIEAQKLNIDKGTSLLKLQLEKYKNMGLAEQATQNIMGAQALAKMQEAAERAVNPKTKAVIISAMAEQKLKLMNMNNQFQNTLATLRADSGIGGAIPAGSETHIRALLSDPKKKELQFFDNRAPNKPVVHFATSQDEAKEGRNFFSISEQALHAVDKLLDAGAIARIPATQRSAITKQDYWEAVQALTNMQSAGIDSKRVNGLEKECAEAIAADPSKWNALYPFERLRQLKREILINRDRKMQSMFPTYKPEPLTSSSPVFKR